MSRSGEVAAYWSQRAATFDAEPDHGLTDATVRAAWRERLASWIPLDTGSIADLGCGTGSLSLLLAEAGHDVVGVDLSPEMIALANAKAGTSGADVRFLVGDVSAPDLPRAAFDAVLCRHVLWTLPVPVSTLETWAGLLAANGRLVLVEGQWFDPGAGDVPSDGPWNGGVAATELIDALRPMFARIDYHDLSDDVRLWGRPVTDERFAVVALERR